jgi:vacuolar-type H+-ATPase subunit E/Vma4
MSIDALLTLLDRQADAEASAVLAAGEAKARAILAAADAQVASRREQEVARVTGASRHALARATAAAGRRHREARLRERERVIDQVLAEAALVLATASLERYQAILEPAVDATLRYLEGLPAVLRCRPDAAPQIERLVAGRTGVTVAPDADARAGVLGEAEDGSVAVDNTLTAWLTRRRPALAAGLAARLDETIG